MPDRLRSLPGRLADACLRWQCRAAGLVSLQGHHVLAPGLGEASTVIDAGAHTGAFAREVVGRFGCLCYALEPVPELLARIAEAPRLRPFRLALAGTDGEAEIHLSDHPEANSLYAPMARQFGSRGSLATRMSTLESFLREVGLPRLDLLKLDIEGAEIAVLDAVSDKALAEIGQITVEFHDFLPGFADGGAIERLKRRLRQAGFVCLVISRPAGDHSDTLFLNRRRLRLGPGTRLHLFLMSRLTLELRRLLHRVRAWMS
jgi:FkbM family methyltransferase